MTRIRDCRRIVLTLVAVTFTAIGAHAQNSPNLAAGCGLETLGTGSVRRVIDGRTIQLEVGQQIRLAAIEVPPLPLPRESGPQVKAGLAAKAALESMLSGRTVTLKNLDPMPTATAASSRMSTSKGRSARFNRTCSR